MSELIKRVIVAIIGIPLAIAIIYAGQWYLAVVLMVLSILAMREFYDISEKKHSYPNKIMGYIVGVLLIANFQYFSLFQSIFFAITIIITFTLMALIFELWRNKPNSILNIAMTLAGVLYIPVLLSTLLFIRHFYDIVEFIQSENFSFIMAPRNILATRVEGAWLLVSILVSIWICDSAAYFIGKAIGKRKLFERISPKKTWEGAMAGLVFAIISFWGASELMLRDFPFVSAIVIGLIVGIVGQLGDLCESQIKRDAGVKDSSDLLPGHGGILDRLDSILFVMPTVFIYLFFVVVEF